MSAVEPKRHALRPCVVIAGGREPPHWEAYPGHQFIHTIGALPCCARTGCWKNRVAPLGDGDERDRPQHLCVEVMNGLPRCLDLIRAEEVIRRIELSYQGGNLSYLAPAQWHAAKRGIRKTRDNRFEELPLTEANARLACEQFIRALPPGPEELDRFKGRGIVICAGGCRYFTNAWVCVNLLRQHGCTLPIQVWHFGAEEMSGQMRALLETLGVECVDAAVQRRLHPCRSLAGWALKPFAVLLCRFEEVLCLDPDNVPVADPAYLFDSEQFRATGAVFWPDLGRLGPTQRVWDLLGLERPAHPEFESGQLLVDKRRCWRALRLALWMNEHSDFFYRYLHGDKETFHLAFRKLNQPFVLISTPVHQLRGTMCQHDLEGRRLFQHRNTDKWSLFANNPLVEDFWHEDDCRQYLKQLQGLWDGHVVPTGKSRVKLATQRPWAPRVPLIEAGIIACPFRQDILKRTLTRLRQTDWGDTPVLLQELNWSPVAAAPTALSSGDSGKPKPMGERCARGPVAGLFFDSRLEATWELFHRFLAGQGEYLLLLEDDVEFNRRLRENLVRWPLVRAGAVTVAGLCNCGLLEQSCDLPNRAYLVRANKVHGSQAFLISRNAVQYLAEHRQQAAQVQGVAIARLAERMKRPLVYHSPSLVQPVGARNAWEEETRPAADFDPAWLAPETGVAQARTAFVRDGVRPSSGAETCARQWTWQRFSRREESRIAGPEDGHTLQHRHGTPRRPN
jgi:hypothetical protein